MAAAFSTSFSAADKGCDPRARLEKASDIELGFPRDFLRRDPDAQRHVWRRENRWAILTIILRNRALRHATRERSPFVCA
jgi:hypothetical protein